MELNPDNPTTAAVHDHWHTIVAVMLVKLKLPEVLITHADIEAMHRLPENPTVLVHDSADGLRIKLISQVEAIGLMEMQQRGKPS